MSFDVSVIRSSTGIDQMLERDLSPNARRAILLQHSLEYLTQAEADRSGAHVTLTVDGLKDATLAAIKAESVVIFSFSYIGDLIVWIDAQLRAASPIEQDASKAQPGRYERSFIIYADGTRFDPDSEIPDTAKEYVFMNTQPYAAKIERGQSPQAPEGVFQGVAHLASNLVNKNFATVAFEYRTPPFDEIILRHFGSRARNVTPAIVIEQIW